MKFLKTLVVFIPFMMISCLEVETTSKVNRDGSIERNIRLKGSAENIKKTKFNIPRQDLALWRITQDSLDEENDQYQAIARFESVEDLNQSFKRNTSDPGVEIISSLVLDEGFFFNRYYYQENIWADLPGPDLPMDTYLSQAELEALIVSETEPGGGALDTLEAARLEHQLDLYIEDLIYEDFVTQLREGGKRAGTLVIIDEMFKEHSDSLSLALNSTDYSDENLVWMPILEKYLDVTVIDKIQQANAEGFTEFYASWKFFEEVLLNDYQFSVELPGVIRNTSALDVRGNRMNWEPSTIRLFFGGISLEAESSVVKPWSLIITGLLLLLTLAVTVAGYLRQRSQ